MKADDQPWTAEIGLPNGCFTPGSRHSASISEIFRLWPKADIRLNGEFGAKHGLHDYRNGVGFRLQYHPVDDEDSECNEYNVRGKITLRRIQ